MALYLGILIIESVEIKNSMIGYVNFLFFFFLGKYGI